MRLIVSTTCLSRYVSLQTSKGAGMRQTNMQPLEILSALGLNGTPTVIPVQGGFDTALWKVESEGQTYALRVFRPGRQEDCERERVVMAAARAAGLPVPEVRRAGIWQDQSVLLITWLAGRVVADELRARPWHVWRLGIVFGRMQAAIHAVPAPDLLRQQPEHGWPGNAKGSRPCKMACVTCRSMRWLCCISTITRATS